LLGMCSISTLRLTNQRSAVRDTTHEAKRLAHLYPTDDRELDALAIDLNDMRVIFVRAVVGPETVMLSLLFERRVLTGAGKKVPEGTQILDGPLRGVLRHIPHPRELFILDAVELAAQRAFGRFLASKVLSVPLRRPPVVGKARRVGAGRGAPAR
jgi:hypothetical protein